MFKLPQKGVKNSPKKGPKRVKNTPISENTRFCCFREIANWVTSEFQNPGFEKKGYFWAKIGCGRSLSFLRVKNGYF